MLKLNRNAINIQANININGNQPLSKTPSPPQLKSVNNPNRNDLDLKKPRIALKPTQQSQAQALVLNSRIPVLAKAQEKEKEEEIEDIDKTTSRDAIFLVSDIAKDIYQYMFELEVAQPVEHDYLKDQKILTPKVRQRLINWVIEIHLKLKLIPETLFVAVSIIDRYFNKVTIKQQSQVQLVACGAMLIAAKYEEIYPPEINDLILLSANAYSRREIMRAEIEILEQLNFDLGRPIPLAFLRRFSKAAHCDLKMHSIAKFLLEMCLTEYECSHWHPSLLAATALYTVLHLVHHQHENQQTTTTTIASFGLTKRLTSQTTLISQQSTHYWNKTLMHYSNYSREQLQGPASTLCKVIKRVLKSPQSYTCVKKYAQNLSRWTELKSARVDELIKLGEIQ